MILRRLAINRGLKPRLYNLIRSVSSGGFGRINYHSKIRALLDTDISVGQFLEGERAELPTFYARKIRSKLSPLWDMLPEGATMHDHHVYLHSYLLSGTCSFSCWVGSTRPGAESRISAWQQVLNHCLLPLSQTGISRLRNNPERTDTIVFMDAFSCCMPV